MKKLLLILCLLPGLLRAQGVKAVGRGTAGIMPKGFGVPGVIANNNPPALLDPATTAWISVTGITNGAVILAYNVFVTTWKSNGWWTNTVFIHPYTTDLGSGDPARFNQMKYNLKDPQDLDASYRLSVTGTGSTFTTSGYTNGGATNWITTHGTPAAVFSNPNGITMIVGISTNVNAFQNDYGSTDFSGTNRNLTFAVSNNSALATVSTTSTSGADMSSSAPTSKALWCIWRTGGTASGIYKNNSSTPFNTSAVASVALGATQEMFIGAISNGGSGVNPSTKTYVIDIAYNGTITGSDWVSMSTAINTLETSLESALGLSAGTRSWF